MIRRNKNINDKLFRNVFQRKAVVQLRRLFAESRE